MRVSQITCFKQQFICYRCENRVGKLVIQTPLDGGVIAPRNPIFIKYKSEYGIYKLSVEIWFFWNLN